MSARIPTINSVVKRFSSRKTQLYRTDWRYETNAKVPQGAAHFYIKVNENWGAKFLHINSWGNVDQQMQRLDCTRMRQEYACEHRLATPCSDRIFDFKIGEQLYMGYLTAHAYTTDKWFIEDIEDPKERQFLIRHKSFKENLRSRVQDLFGGIDFSDCKSANCGIYGDDLVVIDWGYEGFCVYNNKWTDRKWSTNFGKMFADCR
jgi:hypothetical protein